MLVLRDLSDAADPKAASPLCFCIDAPSIETAADLVMITQAHPADIILLSTSMDQALSGCRSTGSAVHTAHTGSSLRLSL